MGKGGALRLLVQRPPVNDEQTIAVLQGELALLREENTHLRVERSREMGVQRAIERARMVTAATVPAEDSAAATELVKTQVLRELLLDLCREVSRALTLVQQQLHSDVPLTETDRRMTERRPTDSPAAIAATTTGRPVAPQRLALGGIGERPPSLSVPAKTVHDAELGRSAPKTA